MLLWTAAVSASAGPSPRPGEEGIEGHGEVAEAWLAFLGGEGAALGDAEWEEACQAFFESRPTSAYGAAAAAAPSPPRPGGVGLCVFGCLLRAAARSQGSIRTGISSPPGPSSTASLARGRSLGRRPSRRNGTKFCARHVVPAKNKDLWGGGRRADLRGARCGVPAGQDLANLPTSWTSAFYLSSGCAANTTGENVVCGGWIMGMGSWDRRVGFGRYQLRQVVPHPARPQSTRVITILHSLSISPSSTRCFPSTFRDATDSFRPCAANDSSWLLRRGQA
jgi:hypothetical protein